MTASYRQILKSTALLGGAQVVNIGVGIVRTKILALLLGPSGLGLSGLYVSTTSLIGTLTGFGIGSAGVRQIAEASGSGDENRIARTVQTLRLTSLLSGILGMVLVVILSPLLARWTFNDPKYAAGIALVSLTLLFGGISGGQLALLQGMRRLKELAACTIWGGVFGTIISIGLVWWLKERGIVWFIVSSSAFTILTAWWYARRISVKAVVFRFKDYMTEARALVGMGGAFLVSGLLGSLVAYLTRILVVRELGMDSVGLYAAAWTLASLYAGMVINAMGTDFYPRLTAASADNEAMCRLVNEQTEMGLLMALPGVVATLVFAPWVMKLFYSAKFLAAAPVIQWMVLGVALRVISFPMGYILLAKGKARMFAISETVFSIAQVALLLACMKIWQLEGVGVAFAAMYLFLTIWIFFLSWRVIRFLWTPMVVRLVAGTAALCGLAFIVGRFCAPVTGLVLGGLLVAVTSAGCLWLMQKILHVDLAAAIRKRFA